VSSPPVTHLAPTHASGTEQAPPASHAAPSDLGGLEHVPVAEEQVPTSWHWSSAVQTTGSRPVHAPPSQMSVRVQASPSSQSALFGVLLQVPDGTSQSSSVQGFKSSQSAG